MAPPVKDADLSRVQRREGAYLHEMGWSVEAIARRLGISQLRAAIEFDPEQAVFIRAQHRQKTRNRRTTCPDCERRTWGGRCYEHAGRHRATTVRETTLRCAICLQWKPDSEFSARGKNRARRYRDVYCRECSKARRG